MELERDFFLAFLWERNIATELSSFLHIPVPASLGPHSWELSGSSGTLTLKTW
jgi:hypothetical protein